jgi:hypothetical protein
VFLNERHYHEYGQDPPPKENVLAQVLSIAFSCVLVFVAAYLIMREM